MMFGHDMTRVSTANSWCCGTFADCELAVVADEQRSHHGNKGLVIEYLMVVFSSLAGKHNDDIAEVNVEGGLCKGEGLWRWWKKRD